VDGGASVPGVTSSGVFYQEADEIWIGVTLYIDTKQFKKDERTFFVEIPAHPGPDSPTTRTAQILYVVWLNSDNGETPDSPPQKVPSGMDFGQFLVNGVLDYGKVFATTAPDGTPGSRFIDCDKFMHRQGSPPWNTLSVPGQNYDGYRGQFSDQSVAQSVADSTLGWIDHNGVEGPPTYHVESYPTFATYAAGGNGAWWIGASTFKSKGSILLDNHNIMKTAGISNLGYNGGAPTSTLRFMFSISLSDLDIGPAGSFVPLHWPIPA